MKESNRYYGKYRGTVINNVDPKQLGRIQATVPDVQGLVPTTYALPCLPIAGKQNGIYMVPKIGDGVWIEFEQGDPDYPIWVGCFWGDVVEVPLTALAGNPAAPSIVFQSLSQHAVIVSDMPPSAPPPLMPPVPTMGGIILRSATGAYIVVNDSGIFISNGMASIEMIGKSVFINKVALVVT